MDVQIAWLVTLASVVILVLVVIRSRRDRAALQRLDRALRTLEQGKAPRPIQPLVSGPGVVTAATFDEVAATLERRIAQQEQDRQQLGAVLSGMSEAVLAVDHRRRLVFANPSADRLFGLNDRAVGRLVPEVIRSPRIHEAIDATLSRTEPYQGEIVVAHVGGEAPPRAAPERIVSVHGTPLPGAPHQGAVLVLHDITELRQLERMRRDFVANVSHELKTPLASVRAYVETLLDGAINDEAVNEHFLRQIDQQAERLNQLILDLLTLARIESLRESSSGSEPMAIVPAVRDRTDAQRDRAIARKLRYILQVQPEAEDALVEADEEALRQILDNLIDNAIKYTPEGGRIRIVCRLDDMDLGAPFANTAMPRRRITPKGARTSASVALGSHVTLEVVDTGLGIPHAELPRIFERFYRVDKARSRDLGGTGLGLAIVKHMVQALDGQIEVESRLGAGTTFRVRLPRYFGTRDEPAVTMDPAARSRRVPASGSTTSPSERSPESVVDPSVYRS